MNDSIEGEGKHARLGGVNSLGGTGLANVAQVAKGEISSCKIVRIIQSELTKNR